MICKLYQLQLDITTTKSIELICSVSIAGFFPPFLWGNKSKQGGTV